MEAALTDDKSDNESTSMTNKERFTIENAFTFLYSPLLPDERELFKSFYKEINTIDSNKVITTLHGQPIKA